MSKVCGLRLPRNSIQSVPRMRMQQRFSILAADPVSNQFVHEELAKAVYFEADLRVIVRDLDAFNFKLSFLNFVAAVS